VPFGNGFAVRSTGHFGPKVPMNHTPQRPVTSESTIISYFVKINLYPWIVTFPASNSFFSWKITTSLKGVFLLAIV
jgi:hypothetical protein